MKIALISLDQAWESKDINRERCLFYIQKAHENKCDIVVFPEMTLTGFTTNISVSAESHENSETITFFSRLSLKYHINIVFGVILLRNKQLPGNFAIITSPLGEVVSEYAKIHPFSFAGENRSFSNGNSLSICKIDNINIGTTVCYDLRFPELYQALSNTAGLIINIANWPASRIDHWLTLLKARAIENQAFIIGVNRTGVDGKRIAYIKSSKIFNPNGEELQAVLSDSEIDIFEISILQVDYFRSRFPFKKDRKPELYKSIL